MFYVCESNVKIDIWYIHMHIISKIYVRLVVDGWIELSQRNNFQNENWKKKYKSNSRMGQLCFYGFEFGWIKNQFWSELKRNHIKLIQGTLIQNVAGILNSPAETVIRMRKSLSLKAHNVHHFSLNFRFVLLLLLISLYPSLALAHYFGSIWFRIFQSMKFSAVFESFTHLAWVI